MRAVALLVLVAGCGRVAFESATDAATDDAPDAPLGDFGAPLLIAETSDPGTEDDPTATDDALEMYFSSGRLGAASGFSDLFVTRRESLSSVWSAPSPVAELDSTEEDQSAGISPAGLTIYFTSRRTTPQIAGASSNIWMATRTTRANAWSAPALVPELSTTMDEFEPQPDESGLRIVLYRQIGSDRELMEATRATVGAAWGAPVLITSVNTTGDERSPMLADGGLSIYFSSDRSSGMAGVHDLFVAHRPTLDDPFGAPTLLPVNSSADDDDPWVSTDGHVLLFSSTRSGNSELYEARR
ncbi:MAG TPA: hypothetical protein VGM39_24100 [Kofleriaceae bacterium]|jgi:hypothetical protein